MLLFDEQTQSKLIFVSPLRWLPEAPATPSFESSGITSLIAHHVLPCDTIIAQVLVCCWQLVKSCAPESTLHRA